MPVRFNNYGGGGGCAVPMGAMAPANTFLGAHPVLLESGWVQVGVFLSKAPEWPLEI